MPPVSAAKSDALAARMKALGIFEADIDETFVRSGGKGGQNVNKVSTCVVLVHRPSGTTVKCQRERSQAMNRYRARVLLADKIERGTTAKRREAAAAVAKVRRQKRRRSRAAKEKLLGEKRARAETKARRRPVRGNSYDD
jgi:protein subunit release factor B